MRNLFLPLAFLISFSFTSFTGRPATTGGMGLGDSTLHEHTDKVKDIGAFYNDSVSAIYKQIGLERYGLGLDVFRYAITGYFNLMPAGAEAGARRLLTIIDFTKPSTEKRFYCIDLETNSVLFHSLVAHGRKSGEKIATTFSNKHSSWQSSLGFFLTSETYSGANGYSLRIEGLDGHWNNNVRRRAVVVHGADYVSDHFIERYGRLGRSYGCPALPVDIAQEVIDTIKGGTLIFAYYNDPAYLAESAHLDEERAWTAFGTASGLYLAE